MQKFIGLIELSFRYSEALGPRSESAGVTLHLANADSYEFVSSAHWEHDNYTKAVERGVLDGLIEAGIDPKLGIHVNLKNIEFDYYNSSERAFYNAAKCAVKSRTIISESRIR